jgi:hypothetical protein
MLVEIARLTLSQRRDSDAISSASLEEFGGGETSGFGTEAVAPSQGLSRGPLPSSTPRHPRGGGASPSHVHREHSAHAHATHHGHHPLVARRKPTPVHHHHGAATPSNHVTPSPSADVSPHAFASGMGATMPAPSSSRSPLDRPHVEHHREPALYPNQKGMLNVRNQAANAKLAKEHHAAAEAHHPASTPSAPSKGTPTKGDPRGLRGYIREQAEKHGVNPDTAVRVAEHEGLQDFLGDWHNGVATSAGAFQLHKGGLAEQFQKDTGGLDPFDPKNERATIDWSMEHAGRTKSWHPWHGARRAGIGEHEGFSSGVGSSPAASPGGATPRLSSGGLLRPSPGLSPDLAHTDTRLQEIMAAAARHLPAGYTTGVTSGYGAKHGTPGSLHRQGKAMDVQIFDPSGAPIRNRGADATGLYEQLHRHAEGEAQSRYPSLRMGHGINFATSRKHPNEPDLMHFDIGGPRGHLNPQIRIAPVPGVAYGAPLGAPAVTTSAPRSAPSISTALAAARARLARK